LSCACLAVSGEPSAEMESTVGLSPDTDRLTEVLARMEGLATSQTRMEALLVAIQKELGSITMHDKLDKVSETSWAESQEPISSKEVAAPVHGVEVAGCTSQVESLTGHVSFEYCGANCEKSEVPVSLPSDWPACVELRSDSFSVLAGALRQLGHSGASTKNAGRRIGRVTHPSTPVTDNLRLSPKGVWRHVMVNPNSAFHAMYSVVVLLVLAHDLVVIPYVLAWNTSLEGLALWTAWLSCGFWTVDIGVSCITGVHRSGQLEMRPNFVVRNYARTWLVPDLLVVVSDWTGMLTLALREGDEHSRFWIFRFAKLLRLVCLLRIFRAVRIISEFVEATLSDSSRIQMRCFLVVGGIFWVNHIVGCVWFALGRLAPSDTGMRWTDASLALDGEEVRFIEYDLPHQYVASLHWSFAQFTLGAIDIAASNSIERVYNICCMALGLICGSTLVSILSASMVDYQMTRNDQIQRVRKLRRFLRENNISWALATHVQQQAKERLSLQAKIQEKDVPALQIISTDLRTTLRYEMFNEHLSQHAFLRLWMDMDNILVRDLCMKAMESNMIRPHDDLFVPGSMADTAYDLLSGHLSYIQEPTTAPVKDPVDVPVALNRWFCEAALWTRWIHVGNAKARTPCQVLSISGSATMEILTTHPKYLSVAELAGEYSRAFHRRIITARPPNAAWPTDLEVPFTEYSDLVVGMDHETRMLIGNRALGHLQGRRNAAASVGRTFANLIEEVSKGKCVIMVNAMGQIERVVSLVVIDMENAQGHVFVELGKREKSEPIMASCQLPGLKQEAGETQNSTLARLLSRLYLEVEDVEVVSVKREVEWKESMEYGVRTKYTRVIHRIDLLQDLPIPAVALSRSAPENQTPSDDRFADFRASTISHAVTNAMSNAGVRKSLTLLDTPIYRVQSGSKSTFYSWLPPERYQHWKTPAGEKELRHLLRSLNEHWLEDLAF